MLILILGVQTRRGLGAVIGTLTRPAATDHHQPQPSRLMMNLNLNGEAGKPGAGAQEPAVEGHRREGEHASAAMVAVLDPANKQEDVASCLAQPRLQHMDHIKFCVFTKSFTIYRH